MKPPLPYTGTRSRRRPSRIASGTPASFAFASHSATSSAEIAVAATPARPTLRTARHSASTAAGMSTSGRSRSTSASIDIASAAALASVYV